MGVCDDSRLRGMSPSREGRVGGGPAAFFSGSGVLDFDRLMAGSKPIDINPSVDCGLSCRKGDKPRLSLSGACMTGVGPGLGVFWMGAFTVLCPCDTGDETIASYAGVGRGAGVLGCMTGADASILAGAGE